jgi:hypothetical protein
MRRPVSTRPRKSARLDSLRIEALESRQLLTVDVLASTSSPLMDQLAAVAVARSGAIARPVAAPMPFGAVSPFAGPAVSGPYTPAQIRHAYGFDQLSYDGAGQTIAIVDAYDNPTIANDLKAFNARFGLPDSPFIKVTPPGQAAPVFNSGWATEIALDVQWAHAIAPRATILLVESTDASDNALLGAVDYAVQQGALQVSMSWGGLEFPGVTSYDTHFNKPGVTFLASSGDSGTEVNFPAVSPYVTGVGGTYLPLDSVGNRVSETAWNGSGGGISTQEARPSFQAGFVSGTRRGLPDVSYNADPRSGVYVTQDGNWFSVAGTSAGAPQWAGLIALANQGRAAAGLASLGTGQTFGTNSVLYGLAGGSGYTNPNGDFLDITAGSNGTPATVGYDTATGLGSPVANKLVPDLIGPATPPPTTPPPTTPPPSPTGPTLADAGFESVRLPDSGFAYNPTGSAWTFAGLAGLAANGSGFSYANPAAPEGSQVAFLQQTGSISESVAGWAAGSYTVSFQAAQRGSKASTEDFQVLIDGIAVGTFKPTGIAYQGLTTASFTVTAGTHTLAFRGLNSAGGDNTALIDAVTIASASPPPATPPPTSPPPTSPAPTPGDSGFESVRLPDSGFAYNPTGSAWTFAGLAGLAANGSGFSYANPAAPEGSQVAFLQQTGSISESVAGWAAGSYKISLQAAQRGSKASTEDFQVLIDGIAVATFTPAGIAYQALTTASFTVTAGTHTVAFRGLNSAGGDNTALIDNIAIASA